MTRTVLHIDASADLTSSASRAASAIATSNLSPAQVIRRDLAVTPMPQIDEAWATARLVPADKQTDTDKSVLQLSDMLVAELKKADTIVIGMPVYNFGMPASLKAWVDLVARPKVTFEYTAEGPRGLLADKSAIVVYASGGVPMGSAADFATPHLRTVLGFLGITDVTFTTANEISAQAAA